MDNFHQRRSIFRKNFYGLLITSCILVQLSVVNVSAHASHKTDAGKSTVVQAEELRRKWGSHHSIVTDLKHIEEDVKQVMYLQETGDISSNEAVFYFLKMHDFDNNRLLDGHEILAAIRHSLGYGGETIDVPPMTDNDITSIVDAFFEYDDDDDGYISYMELRKNAVE